MLNPASEKMRTVRKLSSNAIPYSMSVSKTTDAMSELQNLIQRIQEEAQGAEFPLDESVYQNAGLDPTHPILYAGNLNSPLCVFGRDLGKDEVRARQPLYGAAGSLVRQGVYRFCFEKQTQDKRELEAVLDRVLLSNTVPYKPPGNKAYPVKVKKRFRPFVEQLLVLYWQGDKIITLGNEAFKWFAPYGPKGAIAEFFQRSDRYSASIHVTLQLTDSAGNPHQKLVTLLPLPHPSPLNQRYYAQFPQLLQERLQQVFS